MTTAQRCIALLAGLSTLLLPSLVAAEIHKSGWPVYRNERFGFALRYPTDLLSPVKVPTDAGAVWERADGRVRLIASAGPNESGETLDSYRRFVRDTNYAGARIDYAPVRDTWFVLSGTKDDTTFYERITFACGGRMIYGWSIVYPTSERRVYDRVVEEIHRGYRPGRGEDGNCS